jgi:purine-cytosine permease-like protein
VTTTPAESATVTPRARQRAKIEQHGIEYIPLEERHSKPANLGVILFGGSLTFSLIIIGWYPVSFGLSWWQAASAVVVGSAAGGAVLAPMGLMGARTGTNNPVASGAFFGVAGRLIGSLLEATASLAFAALSIWTGGDALAGALSRFFGITDASVPRLIAYAVLSVLVTVVSILGHNTMVAAQRFMIPTAGLCMLVGLAVYGRYFDAGYSGTGHLAFGSVTATWVASALICGSTVASYGAYAGDWTRHISTKLHTNGSIVRAMFLGGAFGMGGPFMWGTFTACAVFSSGHADANTPYVLGLVAGAPLWFIPALIYLGLASGTAQAVINTYGTGLDTSAIIPKLNRVQATLLACGIATMLVYFGYFYSALTDAVGVFLTLLAPFSIPWIVIMVIGHFRRKAYYDVDDLQVFNRGQRGGIYWFWHGINFRGLGVWAVSATAGLLCSSNTWYVGPGAAALGGVDVSFVAAGVVAGVLYPLALRLFPEPVELMGPTATADRPLIEQDHDPIKNTGAVEPQLGTSG